MSIFLLIILLAAGYVVYLALQKPDEFRVVRSAAMRAAPEVIFPHLNNLRTGQNWSPWVEMEPNADYSFDGPEEGVGASVRWKGKKVGAGKQTITDSQPNALVRSKLEFYKPLPGISIVDLTLTPEGDLTLVEWSMAGESKFINKLMSVFMDCEKMCGDQFDKGLGNLKALVEGEPGGAVADESA
ncbi:MAG: SRPBCC family protein [Alphaproteobacteria bacterium]|nr:SRPBCC family protein [Alphaproteobacteria bacterium]